MKPNRSKSTVHVSKALDKRDFSEIAEQAPFDPFASPVLEIELAQMALSKRLNRLGITQTIKKPALGLEE